MRTVRLLRVPSLVTAMGLAAALLSAPAARAADGDGAVEPTPTNEITVVRVGAGGAEPRSAAELTTLVDRVNGAVADHWSEQTDGAVRFSATAWPDPVTTTVPCSNPTVMYQEVANSVGFTGGPGEHLLLYVTSTGPDPSWPCDYHAASTGSGPRSGGRAYVRGAGTKVLAHVLGHSLGLADAGLLRCDGYAHGRNCSPVDGYDLHDVMSDRVRGSIGSLSAPQAWTLGVLPPEQVVTFDLYSGGGGQVDLSPISGRSGIRAVRVIDSWGDEHWVEFRPAAGRDAWLGGTTGNEYGLQPGVLVRWRPRDAAPATWLLDGSPSRAAGWDVDTQWALPAGREMSLDAGSFVVRVREQTDGLARVTVRNAWDVPFPRDLDDDLRADLLAVDPEGSLWSYRSSAAGGLAGRVRLGGGWGTRDVVIAAGDLAGTSSTTSSPATGGTGTCGSTRATGAVGSERAGWSAGDGTR